MASLPRYLLISLLLQSILFSIVRCDDEEENLVRGINRYRTSLNLTGLLESDNAECLADEIANQFKNQPCTNTTGANTVPGTEPKFSDYPNLLSKCHLNATTTRDGMIMPVCVPNLVPNLVLSNYTQSQYSNYLNDTKFTGIGIGSEDNWIVVVLTTNTPEGSFTPDTNPGSSDEEENLVRGINRYRTSLNLTGLRESDNAECLADEIANQFKNQPCTNTTGANTVPGTEPQFSAYPNLLSKCHLDATTTRDGMIMPVCVPNLVPDIVLSNYTQSRYSNYLNDTKFTGVGVGSEDNWIVVVLTTNTPEGSFTPGTNTGSSTPGTNSGSSTPGTNSGSSTPATNSANLVFGLGRVPCAVFVLMAFVMSF